LRAATFHLGVLLLASVAPLFPQAAADARGRARIVRDLAKQGDEAVPRIASSLTDPDLEVRLEAVKALAELGGPKTVDPLLTATRDNDSEMQIRATDGLVNVYLPGYVKTGLSGTLRRAGTAVRGKFTDTNDQIVEAFVEIRPDVIAALGRLVRGGSSLECRANAARAAGILRGRAAIPDLIEALRSKDDRLMYESLVAIQKIADPAAAPRMSFLLRDLDEKIQVTALETTGVLRNREAAPDVRDALKHARSDKVKRAAASALAMIADPADHPQFIAFLADRDDGVRAAGAEGLGRLKNPVDRPVLERAFGMERNTSARLSEAYALAMLGNIDMTELAPLRYLVNTLNLKTYKGVAVALLIEIARDTQARHALQGALPRSTKEEKIGLSTVLGRSGDADSVPLLEALSRDPDPDVAAEGLRNLRALRARLP
jgi:HEAT repeat protein